MEARYPATIADVAKAAGVSRAAVSKVIRNAYGVSDNMRDRVQAAIDELDYRPSIAARSMRGASFTIGVEVPSLDNQFFDRMVSGATAELAGSPYQMVIAPTGPDPLQATKAAQALADRHVDGLIVISSVDPAWLEELSTSIPTVVVGRHDKSIGYDTIVDDDILGAYLVVEHLSQMGHERITHLTVDPVKERHHPGTAHRVRAEGYQAAMKAFGLEQFSQIELIPSSSEAARLRTFQILNSPQPPTAIFAGHDELAMGVLAALAESGLTTDDVSVVGYDDSNIARHPLISLTSVDQSADSIGRLAIQLLLERIAGREKPAHPVVIPRVRPRNSTRKLQQSNKG